jgi:hypothetical protein
MWLALSYHECQFTTYDTAESGIVKPLAQSFVTLCARVPSTAAVMVRLPKISQVSTIVRGPRRARLVTLLLLLVIAIEVLLLWAGVLGTVGAVTTLGALEIVFLLLGLRQVLAVRRAYGGVRDTSP